MINPKFSSATIALRAEMLNTSEAKQAVPFILRFLCRVAPNPPCSEEPFVHTITSFRYLDIQNTFCAEAAEIRA